MDQHQAQQSHTIVTDDHHGQQYPVPYYSSAEPEYGMPYSEGVVFTQVVQQHPGSQTHLQQQGLPQYHNHGLNLITPHQYQNSVYSPSTSPHGNLPISASPPPQSPDMYDPLSPPVSGSDTSGDGIYHHNSSGQNSPSSSRANSLVHRTHRYNPTPSPTSSSGRRSRGRSRDSDDEADMGIAFTENLAHSRKEATRRQRIEAEQRRRDELRDGYAKLKDVLPVSNQKSSKVSLLERATNHIVLLERTNADLQSRLQAVEAELARLRALNEKISLSNETPSPGMFDARPLSPPPDLPMPGHATIAGRPMHSDDSSASEGGDPGY